MASFRKNAHPHTYLCKRTIPNTFPALAGIYNIQLMPSTISGAAFIPE